MGDRVLLHSLLEQCNAVHRKDILDVTKGHLNENKLRRKQGEVKGNFWDSAKKEPIWLREKVVIKDHPIYKKQLPPLGRKVSAKDVVVDVKVIPPGKKSAAMKNKNEMFCGKFTKRSGNEDIFYPETMVPVGNRTAPFSKEFLPNHQLFPTKCEQYEQFKKNGKQMLTDKDDVLSQQYKAVLDIEEKMQQKLKLLQRNQDVSLPNYFNFKVYSDAWEELIDVLGKDGRGMASIKKDYDSYVNSLLEEQVLLHDEYYRLEDNSSLLNSEKAISDFVKVEEERLRTLEDQLLEELEENERLRVQIKQSNNNDETDTVYTELEETDEQETDQKGVVNDLCPKGNTVEDLESHVMRLHAQIEEKYHQIANIKKTQREEYVPRAVCQRLEQCIKEIEVDTQKLTKQNDFLEQDIQELEEELEEVLVKTGCKEKDARLLWHRVSLSRVLNW